MLVLQPMRGNSSQLRLQIASRFGKNNKPGSGFVIIGKFGARQRVQNALLRRGRGPSASRVIRFEEHREIEIGAVPFRDQEPIERSFRIGRANLPDIAAPGAAQLLNSPEREIYDRIARKNGEQGKESRSWAAPGAAMSGRRGPTPALPSGPDQ